MGHQSKNPFEKVLERLIFRARRAWKINLSFKQVPRLRFISHIPIDPYGCVIDHHFSLTRFIQDRYAAVIVLIKRPQGNMQKFASRVSALCRFSTPSGLSATSLQRASDLESTSLSRLSRRSSDRTAIQARSLSNLDNTFRTARFVGALRASAVPLNIRFQGIVGTGDRVDFIKFRVQPGANFLSYTDIFRVSGGALRASVYIQHPDLTGNRITAVGTRVLRGSSTAFYNDPTNNTSSTPITVYVRLSTGAAQVRYNLRTVYNPA